MPAGKCCEMLQGNQSDMPECPLNVIYFNWFTHKNIGILFIINSKMMEELFTRSKSRTENHQSQRSKRGDEAFQRLFQQGNFLMTDRDRLDSACLKT